MFSTLVKQRPLVATPGNYNYLVKMAVNVKIQTPLYFIFFTNVRYKQKKKEMETNRRKMYFMCHFNVI